MSSSYTRTFFLIGLCALALALLFLYNPPQRVEGAAYAGAAATQLVATTTAVGPSTPGITLYTSRTNCAARVVRTQGVPISLIFADPTTGDLASTTISVVKGFTQAASTTVAYDSGIYGCGRMVAYAEATTTLTTMITQ